MRFSLFVCFFFFICCNTPLAGVWKPLRRQNRNSVNRSQNEKKVPPYSKGKLLCICPSSGTCPEVIRKWRIYYPNLPPTRSHAWLERCTEVLDSDQLFFYLSLLFKHTFQTTDVCSVSAEVMNREEETNIHQLPDTKKLRNSRHCLFRHLQQWCTAACVIRIVFMIPIMQLQKG